MSKVTLRVYTEAPEPEQHADGIPYCAASCRHYDGKRCRLLGLRPGMVCQPAVEEAAAELTELRAEIEAAKDALGHGWLTGGASLAEGIARKTRMYESTLDVVDPVPPEFSEVRDGEE